MATKKSKSEVVDRKTYKTSDAEASKICEQFKKAKDYYSETRADWDEKEAILLGHNKDAISKTTTKSQIFDPRLATIILERSFRVMNQLSTGKARALTKKNKGKSMFMDLLLHNYIEPNAISQYGNLLKKFRMENMYSHVYGSYAHLVDYRVSDTYVGPDMFLIDPNDLVPQPGKYSKDDCQYIFVGAWVDKETIKGYKGDNWINIDKLLEVSKGDKAYGKVRDLDGSYYVEQKFGDQSFSEGVEKFQQIYLVTRYERDRWVTFSPDFNIIVRDIENPHLNGKLPIVVKDSIPLRNRFFGLGEIERGKTLQYATNSLWNLYLDGIKFSIFPPKLINLSLVVANTIKNEPSAKWVVKDINNAIREFPISPQGINSFQATYPTLIASMMNMAGTTDTSIGAGTDPSLGRTPQALALIGQRQNARDAYDRDQQEDVISETYDLFLDLVSKKQEVPIKIQMFDEEIKTIAESNPDIVDMFESGDGGEILIKPEDIKDANYKYYIDKGSTFSKDEILQKQEITDHLALAVKLGDPSQLSATGKVRLGGMVIDVAELFKKSLISGGVQDWDKIVYEEEPEEMPQQPSPEETMGQMPQGAPQMPQGQMPMGPEQGMPQMPMQGQPMQPQGPQMGGGMPQGINFEDPVIQQAASDLFNGRF